MTVTTLIGSSVRLSCACAKSRSNQTSVKSPITWTFTSRSGGPLRVAHWNGVDKNDVSYVSTTKYHMVTSYWYQGDLVVYYASLADQGIYTCEIVERCTVSLDINVPVSKVLITFNRGQFLKDGDVVTIEEHNLAFVKCYSFGAKPAANITWSFSRRPITFEVSRVSFSSHTYRGRFDSISTLKIRRISVLGYLRLTCCGRGTGSSMANSSVILRTVAPLTPPTITGGTNITLATIRRSVILTCSTINSYPVAVIRWYVGGMEHPGTSHHRERHGRFDVTSYLELVVDGEDDGLGIICKVSSPLKTVEKAVKLTVFAPPLSLTVNWTESPVTEGESLTVLCTAHGANPAPHVYWERPTHRIKDTLQQNESLLHLSHATRKDAGRYSCLAENQISSAPSISSFTLLIFYEPVILTKLRTVIIPQQRRSVNITCVAEAIPPPVIKWTSQYYVTNLSRPITLISGTVIIGILEIPGNRGDLPFTFHVMCSASNIVGRTSWTTEIRYEQVSDDDGEISSVPTASTEDLPTLCGGHPDDSKKVPIERPLLIATISACFLFLLVAVLWYTRRRLKMDEFWLVRRDGFYVDMTRRRAGVPGISTVNEEIVSNTTSPRLTPSSGASIRFEFVSQQSVENTYDSIPVVSAMPTAIPNALQPRRRRVHSDDGYYYDVPPPPRGFDTIRRVQSRQLPTIPTVFVPPETMQAVLRSLSRDAGERERPSLTLEQQPGGRSETIIREEVQLFKKSQLRRVLSL
ncbi:hemicentin-1-like [Lytechinus pictus]|uniref:hemicentin-1-like n=1 Tax=Lytechinus pictus TaxID=7653 RepID=UPI0030B9B0F6